MMPWRTCSLDKELPSLISLISIRQSTPFDPSHGLVVDMPGLHGFHVQIYCDGHPLKEYSSVVENASDTNVATCWIPTEAGKVSIIRNEPELLP
jgi:hypothetical protein